MESREEKIDFKRIWEILKERKRKAGAIIIGCTVLSLIAGLVWPPTYRSTTTVQTRSVMSGLGSMSGAAALLGLGNVSTPTMSYVELMKSNTVLQPIIDELNWDADEKEFLTPEKFAKKNLVIENTKQTNLIKVTAKGKTPEEAQMISQHVVDNFLAMQTDKSQQTQSLLVKFLDERVEKANKEAEEAAQKLAEYSREHKIYSPDEQVKLALTELAEYDKAISEMQANGQSAKAQYQVATQKLSEQKAGALNYNINDNATVQQIRAQIVGKEVELTGLRQKYTEQYPDVIKVTKELKELNNALENEVASVVASNAATLNPAQMELLKAQAVAQAKASAAEASEKAITAKRDEKEQKMGSFPDDAVNYLQLERDAKIKQEIYTHLVQQCEESKIKEAMESMDIQVIDPANLPFAEKPEWPRPKLMTALGFVLGCILTLGYGVVAYKREG